MFKIESYVTPILLSYVDKYVRDFKPANAQVSLWGGGVALQNLVLKEDVLQREVQLPFTLVSGRIHELLINVPWTKIMSEPIVITIDTIECVLNVKQPPENEATPEPPPSRKTQVVEAPPGYMQALVRRIVSNIAVKVHHLIVKYVHDDIVLSLNVKHLSVDSAGSRWEQSFADIDPNMPVIRRLVRFDDLTLCLDKSDADGKIRFYQEPLLYRCQLDLRVFTRLVSATTRRASVINIQLRSSKLAFSVTSDQVLLLLRLANEWPATTKPQATATKAPVPPVPAQQSSILSHVAEPARSSSWSEWAWSWLPSWSDRESNVDELPTTPTPLPVYCSAFVDEVAIVVKTVEVEISTNRRRFRSILELVAMYLAFRSVKCAPTAMHVRFGVKSVELRSTGKCVCGSINYETTMDRPTIYLNKTGEIDTHWQWPAASLECEDSGARRGSTPATQTNETSGADTDVPVGSSVQDTQAPTDDENNATGNERVNMPGGVPEGSLGKIDCETSNNGPGQRQQLLYEMDELWTLMDPLIYFDFAHDRSPPFPYMNPYDNPPQEFEYSDWVEEFHFKATLKPMDVRVCTGLIHRLMAIKNIINEAPMAPKAELQKRVLTIEECDALSDNIPQRRITFEVHDFRVYLVPLSHTEPPTPATVLLCFELPSALITLTGPLYPHRVCAAACQMPHLMGPLAQSCRFNVTVRARTTNLFISTPNKQQQKPCCRFGVRLVGHDLLNKSYFTKPETVKKSYLIKIEDVNVSGSAARLRAAWLVFQSLIKEQDSNVIALKYTSLPQDVMNDEDKVAIDFEVDEIVGRGYQTDFVNTHIWTVSSAKATAYHEPSPGEVKQAWLFSAPDCPVTSPYLRIAVQWSDGVRPGSCNYIGLWTEPTACSLDPLFISWLEYSPVFTSRPEQASTSMLTRNVGSTQYLQRMRAKTSPPVSRSSIVSTSDAERVHIPLRNSIASSTEPSEKKSSPTREKFWSWWRGEKLVDLHARLRNVLIHVEMGLVLVYVTMTSVSALDCATVLDAMHRHVIDEQEVLVLSLGRIGITSNPANKQLWNEIKHDGPTFLSDDKKPVEESFPWKIRLADVSCYTLEPPERRASSVRSNIKETSEAVKPHSILDLVTTTIVVTVVTKTANIRTAAPPPVRKHTTTSSLQKSSITASDQKTKFFTSGKQFKPATLKEFFRGPRSKKDQKNESEPPFSPESNEEGKPEATTPFVEKGPLVSLGVNLHADTPPVIVRLNQKQLQMVAATIHCFNHMVKLLKQEPLTFPKRFTLSNSLPTGKSVPTRSDGDDLQYFSEDSKSSDTIDILKPSSVIITQLKTFLWFQWVVNRASLVLMSSMVKLVMDIDDIFCTVDLQAVYNQFRVKVMSAAIRHYERISNQEWVPGALGGRVLEASETVGHPWEKDHFLALTVTNAQYSDLPQNWKQELHPKLLEHSRGEDTMWEVYAVLAPLQMMIRPIVLESIGSLVAEMRPRPLCPSRLERPKHLTSASWPFCYLTAGGIRLLIRGNDEDDENDDTFVFNVGLICMNPHPENPVCRRLLNTPGDAWPSVASHSEGRQYEINIKNVKLQSAQFTSIVSQELSALEVNSNMNPAMNLNQVTSAPDLATILHAVNVCCVLAPAVYSDDIMTLGSAVDFNLTTDCIIDINLRHIIMCVDIVNDLRAGLFNKDHASLAKHGQNFICPYSNIIHTYLPEANLNSTAINEDQARSVEDDSGVETVESARSKSKITDETEPKKFVSYAYLKPLSQGVDYLEVFFTMGTVECSLHIDEDDSDEVVQLRPPPSAHFDQPLKTAAQVPEVPKEESKLVQPLKQKTSDSLKTAINMRELEAVPSTINLGNMEKKKHFKPKATLPVLYLTLMQPNLYYWRNRGQRSIQVSLFNAGVGLGAAPARGAWHLDFLTTGKGVTDPLTGIPPALATLKIVAPVSAQSLVTIVRGSIKLDVERPIEIGISEEKIRRLKIIYNLLKYNLIVDVDVSSSELVETLPYRAPFLYKLRQKFVQHGIESVVVNTGQVGLTGNKGALGWDSVSFQMIVGSRIDKITARLLLTALVITVGPPNDSRHVMLRPVVMGVQMEALWEAWRRAEGGMAMREPSVQICLELDRIIIDLRPSDLETFNVLLEIIRDIIKTEKDKKVSILRSKTSYRSQEIQSKLKDKSSFTAKQSLSFTETENTTQYYKDDLRSGAFKLMEGGQLPMAYQVNLHGNTVSWRYPHPRSITRIVAFPLPGADEEIDCVLEVYTPVLNEWEPHTYFKIPVNEPRDLPLYVPTPEAVFATMWRFRTCKLPESSEPKYVFSCDKFRPKLDSVLADRSEDDGEPQSSNKIAEQLSGILRVDSYFAPQLLPRLHLLVQIAATQLHLYNSLPLQSSMETSLEGYYVSRPLMRRHRVLSARARCTKTHVLLGTSAGTTAVVDTILCSDVIDCATGTMEHLMKEVRMQAAVSTKSVSFPIQEVRARIATGVAKLTLHVPRLRTLHALLLDWSSINKTPLTPKDSISSSPSTMRSHEAVEAMATALEGRVFLWVHNSSATALRIGQQGTDEVVPLGPGVTLAYRWNSPESPQKLRVSCASPSANWQWSKSIPFTSGSMRVKLEESDVAEKVVKTQDTNLILFSKVVESGGKRIMTLSGRLTLANLLRYKLLYKVKVRCKETGHWNTVCSGEMEPEYVGKSVICHSDTDLALKIKNPLNDVGWSGDIPLKECPKENVPWLVKLPTTGTMSYESVWCRVVRARSDGRILAMVWPLYVLYSHLPLDTEVLIVTEEPPVKSDARIQASSDQEKVKTTDEGNEDPTVEPPPTPSPTVQSTPGRGCSTHLSAPGTTAHKHSLSFQYRDLESPVTREAVPMHYGVTDVSVFDKRVPVMHIEEVLEDIHRWLRRSAQDAVSDWPYSIVSKIWIGTWKPALLQPRCDVTVRYGAVHAGGGCSLEVQLCPNVILCNAVPLNFTLRAYDAAPLCVIESGTAISPPSVLLTKPFFLSIEVGRETFVSDPIEVTTVEPGRYGSLPPRHLAIDHPAHFSIIFSQKVALLTMHYEIKEQINVLGITSTFMIINRLNRDIMISPIAITRDNNAELIPKSFKILPPVPNDSAYGVSMSRFWLRDRWRGGDPSELKLYLSVVLPLSPYPAITAVPVRLGRPPFRRAIALLSDKNDSIPAVVTQTQSEGRWFITVAHDPCPQFFIENHTPMDFYVAQPKPIEEDTSSSHTKKLEDCEGVQWWVKLQSNWSQYYSTPAYCKRYPPMTAPLTPSQNRNEVVMLVFGRIMEPGIEEWCAPVAVTDGEQLLQYNSGVTIKLRVHTYPHSTLLKLNTTDEDDISASDIRRRLDGAVSKDSAMTNMVLPPEHNETTSEVPLAKIDTHSFVTPPMRARNYTDLKDTSGISHQVLDEATTSDACSESCPKCQSDDLSDDPQLEESENESSNFEDKTEKDYEQTNLNLIYNQLTKSYESTYPFRNKSVHSDNEQTMGSLNITSSDFTTALSPWEEERLRFVMTGLVVEVAAATDVSPLFALHMDRTALLILADPTKIITLVTVADVQIDNLQYESGQFDFPVVASTRAVPLEDDTWPPIWNMFGDNSIFHTKVKESSLMVTLRQDKWRICTKEHTELTEVELRVGALALYVEDAYVKAVAVLAQAVLPASTNSEEARMLAECRSLQRPVRLRRLHIYPLDLTLTLHTAVRMYIALDQSPLRLSAFKLHDVMTSPDQLTHALTVHYLAATILGAGWVVGGLELLGAPGALATRLGGATGGVKGVASATAAALLRSLSAWAGSLARNLDILAGDEDHARRAAAARRRLPPNFIAGLMAGFTNFAINILGAVGGLAHHPLVGVAVGETDSSVAALRRSIVGALTKPLSATADLVAFAGHGLLKQTGWDPVPSPRSQLLSHGRESATRGWRRDCVRWEFRLSQLNLLDGFEVLIDKTAFRLLITDKYLVIVDSDTEKVLEMLDLKACSVNPLQGDIIELKLTQTQRKQSKSTETRNADEDEDDYQINATAMARVARYTGTEGAAGSSAETRLLTLLPAPGNSYALYGMLITVIHQNDETQLSLL